MTTAQRKLGSLTFDIPAIFIGLKIVVEGVEKLESIDHHPLIASSLLLLGVLVLAAAFLPLWLEKRLASAHALCHMAEGIAIALSAILQLEQGKLRMPMVLLGTGLLYLVAGYLESQPLARRQQLAGPALGGIACFLLAGGVLLAGFTAFGDRDPWAFGASGMFVVMGTALLLARPWLLRLPWPASHVTGGEAGPPEPLAR
jgi:hypothetical protein